MPHKTVVYLTEERIHGELISMGAYASRVVYTLDGIEYDEYIENDYFEIVSEPFEYESE